ncbi:MAG: response regulator [Chloroflexota bacterium]
MAEKILIVDDDVDTLRLVGIMLQRQGYQITAATNGQVGLNKALEEQPDLILLDVMMPDMDGYEVTRRLRQNPTTAQTPILMFTAKSQLDDKVAGFEVGVDDYLTKPTHPAELQAHVKALLSRVSGGAKEDGKKEKEKRGRVTGVLAARGGLGVSTVALNLSVALFSRTQAQVVLAELIPGKGTLGMDLGMTNQKALVKFLSGSPSEITSDRVKNSLVPHISGIKLLPASDHPSDIHLVNQMAQYTTLVSALSNLARFIVLDLGSGLLPFTQKLLPLCDDFIVVVEGSSNVIQHTKLLIADLLGLGVKKESAIAVLNNRVRSDTQMTTAAVQEKLGHPIPVTMTPAPELLTQATRMQTAAILCQPEGVTAKQMQKLADQIIQNEAAG